MVIFVLFFLFLKFVAFGLLFDFDVGASFLTPLNFTFGKYNFSVGLFLESLGVVLFFYGLIALIERKIKNHAGEILSYFLNLFFSILMLANIVYIRFFNKAIPIKIFKLASHVPEMQSAVVSLIKPIDVLFVLDLIILPILFILFRHKINFKLKPKLASIICVGSLLLILASHLSINIHVKTTYQWSIKETLNKINIVTYYATSIVDEAYATIERKSRNPLSYPAWIIEKKLAQTNNANFNIDNQKPNIFIIQLESFHTFLIDLKSNNREITPNINKLSKNGIYFKNFISMYGAGSTSDAEFATLTSLYPQEDAAAFVNYDDNDYYSLPNALNNYGYKSYVLHANQKNFWNRNLMLKRLGVDRFYSRFDYKKDEVITLWISDESFFRQSLNFIPQLNEPFLAYFITVTGHFPWHLPKNKQADWIASSAGSIFTSYLQAMHYLDNAVGNFMSKLDQMGYLENSIVLLFGDHGLHQSVYLSDVSIPNEFQKKIDVKIGNFTEKLDTSVYHVPLIIYGPKYFKPKSVTKYASQIDITPTILKFIDKNAFDPFLGFDLLSDTHPGLVLRPHYWQMILFSEDFYCTGTRTQFETCFTWKDFKTFNPKNEYNNLLESINFSDDLLFYKRSLKTAYNKIKLP
jgi:phosphoglycerol transferase MdoB-like AlkP superfamily enzyme